MHEQGQVKQEQGKKKDKNLFENLLVIFLWSQIW